MSLVRVALDVPVSTLFDYRLEHATRDLVGARVLVPFGRGQRAGLIVEVGGESELPPERIKKVAQVFTREPRLATDVLRLIRFASRYYHHPIGQAVMGALPQGLRRARVGRDESLLALTSSALSADWSTVPRRAVAKRRVLDHLCAHGASAPAVLRALATTAPRALKDLIAQGWVAAGTGGPPPIVKPENACAAAGPALIADQEKAIEQIGATLGEFAAWLLLGVTGSGKTEVYLRLIERVLSAGGQALLLVPEINLTPQLEARVGARFPGVASVGLHSGVPETERLRRWRAAESGQARIVVGTRLAVFTPMPYLRLIVVDEEHDASLKQQDGLRYSARDLAVLRAKERGVPVVLGSATPSLESYSSALSGRYKLARLPNRATAKLPSIRSVDTRGTRLREGLSQQLIDALARGLAAGEQSLLFINRRGYAPAVICFACGWTAECTRCSARLVLHVGERARLRCHYCGHEEPVVRACPSCGNQDLTAAGHGTQRIEHAVSQLFPQARVLRIDRDSTRKRLAFEQMRQRVHDNEVDILIGTQMLAKGHDFPRLTLVGVVNADASLYSTDFRAGEKLFALLTQVAGRAGRGDVPGEVLIQTDFPGHPVYEAVRRQDYAAFAQLALEERREAGFPPHAHQVLLRAEAVQREAVDRFLKRAASTGRRLGFKVEVYDPVPATIARVAGRERGHLLVQSGSRDQLQRFVSAWEAHLSGPEASQVRWALDVDPLDL